MFSVTNIIIIVMYAKDVYGGWFHLRFIHLYWYCWFFVYYCICWYVCYYMCVWKRSYVWCVILILFAIRNGEYGNGIRAFFVASLTQCMDVSAAYPIPFHL